MRAFRYPLIIIVVAALKAGTATAQSIPSGSAEQSVWPDVYSNELAEQLFEAGKSHLDQGNFGLAERSLLEAMQIIKVNHGLRSPRQIPVLELLIDSQLSLAAWEAADEHIDYFEWLNARNYGLDLQAYLDGAHALGNLLLSASADTRNPHAVRHLVKSKNLNWQAVNALQANVGENDIRLTPWLYRIVLNHYYQSALIRRRYLSNYAFKTDGDELVSGWSLSRNETVDISYRIGRELLARITTIYAHAEDQPATAQALATVYQGDWELLFDRPGRALRHYRRAHDRLLTAGWDAGKINRYFGRAVVLPVVNPSAEWQDHDDPRPSQPLQLTGWSPLFPGATLPTLRRDVAPGDNPEIKARARFDLVADMKGTAGSNDNDFNPGLGELRVLSTTPDTQAIRDQARREISLLRFRPAFRGGVPVTLESVELEYVFSPRFDAMALTEEGGNL